MENKKVGGGVFLGSLSEKMKSELERRRSTPSTLIFDGVVFAVAFLFSRCHIAFGAYPLGIAFISFLPRGVWTALLGVCAGAFSMGKSGLIYAIISVIVTFLRVIISGGENKEGRVRVLFGEGLLLRVCSAAVGAFVGAVYQMLLSAFSINSILYGSLSVVLAAAFTTVFSGLLEGGISFSDFISSRRDIFALGEEKSERAGLILFQCSFLAFVVLISFSMRSYALFGINLAYIFSAMITLFVAKRFGAARAMAVGFASTLPMTSVYTVAFTLVGLGAGFLFKISNVYALVGGGILLSMWSFYAGDVMGFLSTFPEYVCAALLSFPILKKTEFIQRQTGKESVKNYARDMVNSSALVYKSKAGLPLDALECTLLSVAKSLRSFGAGEGRVSPEEYRGTTVHALREFCTGCEHYAECLSQTPAPYAEYADLITQRLIEGRRPTEGDVSLIPSYCTHSRELFDALSRSIAALEIEKERGTKMELCAEEYELAARLLSEAREAAQRERSLDSVTSARLEGIMSSVGGGGELKAFGERRRHFIGAMRDPEGELITSPKIKEEIERATGVRLGPREYYRRDDFALFECSSLPLYKAEFHTLITPAEPSVPSGDVCASYESVDGLFYSLISDGMGSGEEAARTAHFVADLLFPLLNASAKKSTAFRILNRLIRERGGECSATVDLFEFDLFSGEATFYKCGAAASYVKRGESVFRVRSESAPIGVMRAIDAERIKIEVKSGDFIIMLSDGVSQSLEDAAWLCELLSERHTSSARKLCERVMEAARQRSQTGDDLTVAVIEIKAARDGDSA